MVLAVLCAGRRTGVAERSDLSYSGSALASKPPSNG